MRNPPFLPGTPLSKQGGVGSRRAGSAGRAEPGPVDGSEGGDDSRQCIIGGAPSPWQSATTLRNHHSASSALFSRCFHAVVDFLSRFLASWSHSQTCHRALPTPVGSVSSASGSTRPDRRRRLPGIGHTPDSGSGPATLFGVREEKGPHAATRRPHAPSDLGFRGCPCGHTAHTPGQTSANVWPHLPCWWPTQAERSRKWQPQPTADRA